MNIWRALLYGGAAGVLGTGLGGLLGYLLKKPSERLTASLMNLSGGLMVAVVCFDLLPEGYSIAGVAPTLCGVIIGVLLMAGVQHFIGSDTEESLSRVGILISIGIALHNLPEGLAIGAGFSKTPALGLSLCAVIALHDIPEGLSMAVPLRAARMSPRRVFLYTLLAGMPTAVGVLLGYAVGGSGAYSLIIDTFGAAGAGGTAGTTAAAGIAAATTAAFGPETSVSVCMGIAAGAMLYVISGEMLPSAYDLHRGHVPVFLWVLGLVGGSVISLLM